MNKKMNELIDRLGEEADLLGDCIPSKFVSGRYAGTVNVANIEKFAELLLQECFTKLEHSYPRDDCIPVEELINCLKKHFGVEE